MKITQEERVSRLEGEQAGTSVRVSELKSDMNTRFSELRSDMDSRFNMIVGLMLTLLGLIPTVAGIVLMLLLRS